MAWWLMRPKLPAIALGFFFVATVTRFSHAYLDPGTGMTFVSGIGGFVAGLLALAVGAVALTFRRCVAGSKAAWAAVRRLFGGRPSV